MRIRESLGRGGSLHAGVIRRLSVIEPEKGRGWWWGGGVGGGGERAEHERRMIKGMG